MKHFRSVIGILLAVTVISIACSTLKSQWSAPNAGSVIASGDADALLQRQTSMEITYVANEGVLISSGDKQVLIDGLHREYQRGYAFLPAAQRELIETAKTPFANIDLILVSHMHLDHFHPESVGLHLQHNPGAALVSSQQVIDEVEKKFKDYEAIKARVTGATPPLKQRMTLRAGGIEVEFLGLGHGTERHASVQNLGHVIKLGGKKLLHIGDADTSAEIFEKFNLDEAGIDIAFLPYWFLLGEAGQTIIREHIKPKHIIAVHVSPSEAEKVAGQIKQVFPNAVAFTTMLEKRHY